jgi:predicted PP-loop superfamily ATPase
MDYSGGIGTTGLISDLALGISGKKKYYKRFAAEMTMLEEMQYSSIRYTTSLVVAQTGLTDSAAAAFIVRNPIPLDFVRVASELELKMWVREQYRAELAAEPSKEKLYIGKSK